LQTGIKFGFLKSATQPKTGNKFGLIPWDAD
jgi:hypothetical protein